MEMSIEFADKLNEIAAEETADFMDLYWLEPSVFHKTVTQNPVFHDLFVIHDVYNEMRYLDVKPD